MLTSSAIDIPILPNKVSSLTRKNSGGKTPAQDTDSQTLATEPQAAGNRTRRMRLRAAWMYFIEEMTQNEIAQQLGVGRVTVVRLLSDARERHEIRFSIESDLSECVRLERQLERRFGLREAIVVPFSGSDDADPARAIGAATGFFLSDHVRAGMKIGVGWGRTLWESLRYVHESPIADVSVVSLLGGITWVKKFNPSEFAWRLANLFQAECYLLPAPAIVDTPQTRRALLDHCGIGEGLERARSLDAAIFSVGNLEPTGTSYRDGFVPDELRREMIRIGAVGEVLFHYFDAKGQLIQHPIQERIMAAPVESLRGVPERILVSGGLDKVDALLGAIRLMKPTVLITDEAAAARLLERDR